MSELSPPDWPWFERKFVFDEPNAKYPDVIERLRGTPARISQRLCEIPEELWCSPVGERWSIQEHVGHLGDLEPLWSGRIDDFAAKVSPMRPADLTNRVTHEANHNAASMTELCRRFEEQRAHLIQRLEQLQEVDWSCTSEHPRLGIPMRPLDLCLFVADHDDFHLARITLTYRALCDES